ncbi:MULTISPECIES: sulfurtransferase TusA family protein [Rodentibacter]|uniref:sulfurtransferase TusA family protein n=1 Tax=Rodentibacter TaxID=1960084 RepID=UPI00098627A6|nr:sulfurtransferase TusA family protein [Rodentibacter mrazii]
MDYQLDTQDYRCPLPLLMIKKSLVALTKDDSLLVLISTESSEKEIEQLCESLDCLCQRNEDHSFILRRRSK